MSAAIARITEGTNVLELLAIPEVPPARKTLIWKTHDGKFIEGDDAVKEYLTTYAIENFIKVNKLTSPTAIASAVAAKMMLITKSVESAMRVGAR